MSNTTSAITGFCRRADVLKQPCPILPRVVFLEREGIAVNTLNGKDQHLHRAILVCKQIPGRKAQSF